MLDKIKNWLDGWLRYEKQRNEYLNLYKEHRVLQNSMISRLQRQEKDLKVAHALCGYFKISYEQAVEIYKAAHKED
jgi:hypothetical protein